MHVLRGDHPSVRLLAAVPMKDVLLGLAWLPGLTHRTVVWRGHRLRVRPGTRLGAVEPRLCRFAAAGAGRPTGMSSGGIGSGGRRVRAGRRPASRP
jgi:hypothetical protein